MMVPCPVIVNHWWTWYPPVGTFIALVAVIAFIFPVIYEAKHEVKLQNKLLWTAIVAVLVLFEIRSTIYDRREHDLEQTIARCEQLNNFRGIAAELEGDIKKNQDHFDSTMDEEKGILATAKRVGELSKSNLENITGGDSFAYAVPSTTRGDGSSLILHNDGDQVLTGLSVVIEYAKTDCTIAANSHCYQLFDRGMMAPIDMGTLGPHDRKPVPQMIQFDRGGVGHYNIRVYAQNGQAIEQIWLRRSTTHYGYAYRFNVIRTIQGKPRKGDFKLKAETFRTLKDIGWTEYSPSESADGIHLATP
jgi:hypothetical protein